MSVLRWGRAGWEGRGVGGQRGRGRGVVLRGQRRHPRLPLQLVDGHSEQGDGILHLLETGGGVARAAAQVGADAAVAMRTATAVGQGRGRVGARHLVVSMATRVGVALRVSTRTVRSLARMFLLPVPLAVLVFVLVLLFLVVFLVFVMVVMMA